MIRIVVWTSGMTAAAGAKAIAADPRMELVGLYAHSVEKVGKDIGSLIGTEPLGIAATDDVDALIALKPDCVLYAPFRPNIDHLERLLGAGINVVSSMYKLAGDGYGEDAQARIAAACETGGATLYVSGTYPGNVNMVALAATAAMRRIDRITILESVDFSGYPNEAMYRAMGLDGEPDDPAALAALETACGSLKEVTRTMARALGAELDAVTFEGTPGVANRDTDFGFMTVRKGRIAGIRGTVRGMRAGRSLIECQFTWQLGTDMTPSFPLVQGYQIRLEGDPGLELQILPEHKKSGSRDGAATGTAMGCVNAIEQVVAAPPGILNHMTLPLVLSRGGFGPPP